MLLGTVSEQVRKLAPVEEDKGLIHMLLITQNKTKTFDFHGIKITDYANVKVKSASVAVIEVLPGIQHQTARSTRSDKFYFCLEGSVTFQVDEKKIILHPMELLIIFKNEWFSYSCDEKKQARMLLFHSPSFDIKSEKFKK